MGLDWDGVGLGCCWVEMGLCWDAVEQDRDRCQCLERTGELQVG